MKRLALSTENAVPKKWRRKNYLVNRDLQLRFAVTAFILYLISTLSVWLLMRYVVAMVMEAGPIYYNSYLSFLANSNAIVIGLIIVDGIAVFLISTYFAHGIAGPLYQMEKVMRKYLETGDVEAIVLRKNDMLGETAALINRVLAKREAPRSHRSKKINHG